MAESSSVAYSMQSNSLTKNFVFEQFFKHNTTHNHRNPLTDVYLTRTSVCSIFFLPPNTCINYMLIRSPIYASCRLEAVILWPHNEFLFNPLAYLFCCYHGAAFNLHTTQENIIWQECFSRLGVFLAVKLWKNSHKGILLHSADAER